MPDHLIDPNLFVLSNPFKTAGDDSEKSSSLIVIFSCWKTMIGTAVVSLPWAFQESGMALAVIITVVSFFVSFYTCKLIVDATGNDPDYSDTLKKYYGKCPWVF